MLSLLVFIVEKLLRFINDQKPLLLSTVKLQKLYEENQIRRQTPENILHFQNTILILTSLGFTPESFNFIPLQNILKPTLLLSFPFSLSNSSKYLPSLIEIEPVPVKLQWELHCPFPFKFSMPIQQLFIALQSTIS